MNLPDLFRTGALTAAVAATAAASASNGVLDAERWKTRPLVVFASSADDPLLSHLGAELRKPEMRAGFDERDMVLITVVGDQARRGDRGLSPGQAALLRSALLTDGPATQAVLVGKDGGVKLRQAGHVDLNDIFVAIDGMPMRRR